MRIYALLLLYVHSICLFIYILILINSIRQTLCTHFYRDNTKQSNSRDNISLSINTLFYLCLPFSQKKTS